MSVSTRTFTVAEVARLLGVCDKARLPEIADTAPGQWWRELIVEAITSGQRLGEILDHMKWPHSRRKLYRTMRELFEAAGIDCQDQPGFHGLRRFCCEQCCQSFNRQSRKGGIVA